jgi:hypothetical protein
MWIYYYSSLCYKCNTHFETSVRPRRETHERGLTFWWIVTQIYLATTAFFLLPSIYPAVIAQLHGSCFVINNLSHNSARMSLMWKISGGTDPSQRKGGTQRLHRVCTIPFFLSKIRPSPKTGINRISHFLNSLRFQIENFEFRISRPNFAIPRSNFSTELEKIKIFGRVCFYIIQIMSHNE